MKKINILIIIFVICIILTVSLCLKLIKNTDKKMAETPNKNIEVEKVTNIKTQYNIEKEINSTLEKIYNKKIYYEKEYETDEEHYEGSLKILDYIETMKNWEIKNYFKSFYMEDMYEANLNSKLSFYFIKGYLIYEEIEEAPEGNIEKQEIEITFYKNKKNNEFIFEPYKNSFSKLFLYDDDISKTCIIENTDSFIETEINSMEIFFNGQSLETDIQEETLIRKLYKDYKNKELFKTQNVEVYKNKKLSSFEKNDDSSYTATDSEGKEFTIKLGNNLWDYEINY